MIELKDDETLRLHLEIYDKDINNPHHPTIRAANRCPFFPFLPKLSSNQITSNLSQPVPLFYLSADQLIYAHQPTLSLTSCLI